MSLVLGALSPHPPLLVLEPDENTLEQVRATDISLRQLAKRLVEANPQRLIIISPHAPLHPNAIPIYMAPRLSGDMRKFNRPDISLDYPVDQEFAKKLAIACRQSELPTFFLSPENANNYGFDLEMDHGTFVPLHYISQAGLKIPIVLIGISGLSPAQHVHLGQIIAQIVATDDTPTAILASGDLSHRLQINGPYGFDPNGPKFDEELTTALRDNDLERALSISSETVSNAGECGYKPILTLMSSIPNGKSEQLSYEAPFGIGYCVATIHPSHSEPEISDNHQKFNADIEKDHNEDIRIRIARLAVQEYVLHHKTLELPKLYSELSQPAPTFVTLKIDGELRGCIGTLIATCQSQQHEIIQNAISACSHDPRFKPVSPSELPKLQYQVYVLGELEQVKSYSDLDPQRYGIVVRKHSKSGVLLPGLEGIDTVEKQVQIACRKGNISPNDLPDLYRFEVTTYGE